MAFLTFLTPPNKAWIPSTRESLRWFQSHHRKMQERDVQADHSDDSERSASRSASRSKEANLGAEFRVEQQEETSEMSDKAGEDLVAFVNTESTSISQAIDSALSSTDDSDEDSSKVCRCDPWSALSDSPHTLPSRRRAPRGSVARPAGVLQRRPRLLPLV